MTHGQPITTHKPERYLHRLALEIPRELGDLTVAELWDLCPQGFEEHDVLSPAGDATGWRYVLHASPKEAEVLSSALALMADRLRSLTTGAIHIEADRILEENWREAWKVHFTLQRVSPFVICPSWIEYSPEVDEHVIHLDPGSAFGTGLHESTRLCLRAIAALARLAEGVAFEDGSSPGHLALPQRVLDFGTGTGILGIAACRLFPCQVLAVDNDPLALTACEENARKNHVEGQFQRAQALSGAQSSFDLTLANVSRPVLVDEAPTLVNATSPGGTMVLSGLLVDDAEDVLRAFLACGASLVQQTQENDWIALRLVRSLG